MHDRVVRRAGVVTGALSRSGSAPIPGTPQQGSHGGHDSAKTAIARGHADELRITPPPQSSIEIVSAVTALHRARAVDSADRYCGAWLSGSWRGLCSSARRCPAHHRCSGVSMKIPGQGIGKITTPEELALDAAFLYRRGTRESGNLGGRSWWRSRARVRRRLDECDLTRECSLSGLIGWPRRRRLRCHNAGSMIGHHKVLG